MKKKYLSFRSSFSRTLLLLVILLLFSLVTTYMVILNFAILPSLQQLNKLLAYEIEMIMSEELELSHEKLLGIPYSFRLKIYEKLGISLYTDDAAVKQGLLWAQHYKFLSDAMAKHLNGPTDLRIEMSDHFPVIWVKTWLSPNIWVRMPLTEIHDGDFSPLFYYTFIIMLIIIVARGYLFDYRTAR